ncbi:MAG: hypothetical protein AAGJ35_05765, partial [Myxococcota bacterium]
PEKSGEVNACTMLFALHEVFGQSVFVASLQLYASYPVDVPCACKSILNQPFELNFASVKVMTFRQLRRSNPT